MKNKKLTNDVFVDEIDENSIIVEEKKRKRKSFPWLFILLCFVSLLLSLFFMYKMGLFGFNNKKYVEKNLFVVYSSSNFGDTISDFSAYNSYESSYSYDFSIINGNDDEVSYDVILSTPSINNGSDISYSIERNDKSLFSGYLNDNKKHALTTQKILAGITDEYKLKLWNQNGTDSSIKFKIEVKK